MSSELKIIRTLFLVITGVLVAGGLAVTSAQAQTLPGGLDPAQLEQLQSLSPDERAALLETLRQQAPVRSDRPLTLTELARKQQQEREDKEPPGIQIFDEEGLPILDEFGRPVRVSADLLDQLTTEGPEDWYDKPQPFRQQKIELLPFGYAIFDEEPTTYTPEMDIAVPDGYRLGPGDTIEIQLFGKENRQFSLEVNRDGTINFPDIGPVNVIGQSFQEVRQAILDQVSEQLIGTSASVTMGPLRSINVLVVGDVRRPGSYTVSALSTATNTLLASGGVSKVGSLRRLQLKRNGKVIERLDLYDLLLRGDARDDIRLESGDVILVPPAGRRVSVGGFVQRPAIYELHNESTLGEVIELAGGLRPDAAPNVAWIERVDDDFERTFVEVDLTKPEGLGTRIKDGDILLVPPVLKDFDKGVRLLGHVQRPGAYAWTPGMRLTDVLPGFERLKPQADINYVVIRRESEPAKRIVVLSANLEEALQSPGSTADPLLRPRDQISVFRLEERRSVEEAELLERRRQAALEGVEPVVFPDVARASGDGERENAALQAAQARLQRQSEGAEQEDLVSLDALLETLELEEDFDPDATRSVRIAELLDELRKQASDKAPFERVTVSGAVKAPADYPFEAAMSVSDLIRAGGGLTEAAYPSEAELTRYTVVEDGVRESEIIEVDLRAALAGDPAADLPLKPGDFLTVRTIQNWENQLTVTLEGEVRYPGTYTAQPGDLLSSVIERAGGLTEQAFPEGGIFLREELREREQERISSLRQRLRSDIASLSLQAAGSIGNASVVDAQSAGTALLATLSTAEATGRLVIDLPAIVANGGDLDTDVLLKDGDRLLVPDRTQAVTVIGEVQFPTSHLFVKNFSRSDYIDRSGGLTPNAAEKRTYIVRANGAVVTKGSAWFRRGERVQVGDTIVVPLDTQRGFRLQTWSNITTIIYNAAIAVAAINGLSN